MSDDEDDEIVMELPTIKCDFEDDRSMKENLLAIDSKKKEREREIQKYQNLIRTKTRIADSAIVEILRSISASDDVGDETTLLGAIALVNVLFANSSEKKCIDTLRVFFSLEDISLSMYDENFHIRQLEWFKIAIVHGYFKANIGEVMYTPEIMLLTFGILEKHCLRYTRCSYFAYKVLQGWLNKWHKRFVAYESFMPRIESRLEAIISSNWDNCVRDIAQRNATEIFPIYLRIMSDTYEGFLNYTFHNCVENLSWNNPIKYTILVEVCRIFDDLDSIVNSGLPRCIFTSLTKSHLKSSGTLLYATILGKLTSQQEWKNIFGDLFFATGVQWVTEQNISAIELLCEQWMKPTFAKFPNIFHYLRIRFKEREVGLLLSYTMKIANLLGLKNSESSEDFEDFLQLSVIHIDEPIRLNAFVIISQLRNRKFVADCKDPFDIVKRFLYVNADASTVSLRKAIVENFKILFAKIVKFGERNARANVHVRNYLLWMHEFILDCFEIGSSYQRKIVGLNLYGVILNFMNDDRLDGVSIKSTKCEASLEYAHNLRLKMMEKKQWNLVDTRSAILLVKLVLDQTGDVREKSTSILIRYFDAEVFTENENKVILQKAIEFCHSSMFYDIAGGSALMRVMSAWRLTEVDYIDFFLARAIDQLKEIRKDILMSTLQGSPVYGALTVILELGTTDRSISDDATRKILHFIEEAVIFFLSALSTKDKESSPLGCSSSFQEMSLAIEESIRASELNEGNDECVVSPAHQLVLSCIWMSLKVCCELSAELGSRETTTRNEAIRAINIIVSVLLKCRHKGAITVAGVAIAKLTKALLCKGECDTVMKKLLTLLLFLSNDSVTNLTRRGAGLTIMFHRIVSSDVRANRPFLHFAVVKLLSWLKESADNGERYPTTVNEDCLRDSTRARHLQFLQSLVADKSLQAQLVPYMEDICSTCFDNLQSPDWRVRNASLQLFGAIVPRLVGQSKETQLDYGIGSSVDHFVTHYPKLATNVLTELETFVGSFDWTKNVRFIDLPIKNNVMPILVLLSRMSTSDCDFIDYSSMEYIRRARKTFKILLGHPVFHVRNVAAKAYVAFVPFTDIPCELINMISERIDPRYENYNHGTIIAQSYLGQKLDYEKIPKNARFVFHKHEINREALMSAWSRQMIRAEKTWQAIYTVDDDDEEKSRRIYTIDKTRDYVASASLLYCLVTSKVAFMRMKFMQEDDHFGYLDFFSIGNLGRESAWKQEWSTFVESSISPSQNFNVNDDCYFYENKIAALVDNALKLLHDPSKFHTLNYVILMILHYMSHNSGYTFLLEKLSLILLEIDEKSSRRCAFNLKYWGLVMGLRIPFWNTRPLERMMYFIQGIEDVPIKKMVLDTILPFMTQRRMFNLIGHLSPESAMTRLFLSTITPLLMDEDSDIRNVTARMFELLSLQFHTYLVLSCPRAILHTIFEHLAFRRYYQPYIAKSDALDFFNAMTELINVKSPSSGIKSPYDNDDHLRRDYTHFINMLMYCVQITKELMPMNDTHDDLVLFDGIISMKYDLQREARIDVGDLQAFLELTTIEYLLLKNNALVKNIQSYFINVTN